MYTYTEYYVKGTTYYHNDWEVDLWTHVHAQGGFILDIHYDNSVIFKI